MQTPTVPPPTGPSLESLGYDILTQICALANVKSPYHSPLQKRPLMKPLSALANTSRMMRELCAPGLFRETVVRGNWDEGLRLLKSLAKCEDVMKHTKTFKFDIYDQDRLPPKETAALVVEVISKMTKLNKFVFIVPETSFEEFEFAFTAACSKLPTVQILVVGPYCEFLVPICENVSTVATNGVQWLHSKRGGITEREHTVRLIDAIGGNEKVKRVEIMEWWTVELATAATEKLRSIEYFAMKGGRYNVGIEKLLPLLSKMTNLHTLALAEASNLGVGFHPPRCGNSVMGPNGHKVAERVARERQEACEKVAKMVGKAFGPQLTELWIGEWRKFDRVMDENGSFKGYDRDEKAPAGKSL